MKDVVIVAAGRTAIGNFSGSLAKVPADALGTTVIKGLLEKTGIAPEQVDEVILGQVLTAGMGQNPARKASVNAGLPHTTPAMGISKVCGSGLKALHLAAQSIACGDTDIVIAGGQESMSQSAHVLPGSRNGVKMGDWKAVDTMLSDGLTDAFEGYHMGITTENIAAKYDISREEQDAFGRFNDEIIPVVIPQRRGDDVVFDTDEFPKHGVTAEGLAKLRPAFKRDGTVTAGTSSGINDGAAGVVMMSAEKAAELGLEVLVKVKAYANSGVDPSIMGTGPIPAVQRCLKKAGWTVDDLDLIEANEAFAAQAISVNRDLGWDTSKVNVNGGAIALGHPIGASGARVLVTLVHEMLKRDAKKGIATLCIGGGMGVALAVER